MVDLRAGEDSEVLELGLSDGGAVVSDDHELGLSVAEGAESKFVPDSVFSGLDDQTDLLVSALSGVGFLSHGAFYKSKKHRSSQQTENKKLTLLTFAQKEKQRGKKENR